MALCILAQAGHAAATSSNATARLEQAESLITKNHSRFLLLLAELHREGPRLTSGEQWHLRYLDASEAMFEGDYAKSEIQLHDVIDHSGNPTLAFRSSALLLSSLGINHRYQEAFVLADQLETDLPRINDKLTRFKVLGNVSQTLLQAGQIDLSIKYAGMMAETLPPGETSCAPLYLQIAARSEGKRLRSSSPELKRAIETCLSAQQTVFANAMWLIKSSLYLDEGQPGKAMSLLDLAAPSIRISGYFPHMLLLQVGRAQAYWQLGNSDNARKDALAAVTMSDPGDISGGLKNAYKVLYEIAKKRGDSTAALTYYEHYAAQDKGYLDDISARTLAYQTVQQQVLAKKLETAELSKQNSVLRLQQALDRKAMETSRLYIILLLATLAFIAFWLFRLKRSQLRFKKLSSHDGLTGIYNHQHFMSEAARALRLLEKKFGHACLISIDLDHFKQVNDTHGHAMGDAVLKHTVAICQHHLRPTDLFGRLGGEEFGILLLGCSHDQGVAIADRIRQAIEANPVKAHERVVSFSASVGMASTDTSGYVLQQLCMDADTALYRAKRAGRNRVIADTENEGMVEV